MTRADQLVDAAIAVIQGAGATIPGTTISVTPADMPDVDGAGEMVLPPGVMTVYVGWAEYGDAGPASRGNDATECTLVFLAVEKCGDRGPVSNEWRRVRSAWVQDAVVNPLGNSHSKLLGSAWAERIDGVSFEREALNDKLFWCNVAITYRDEG